MTSELKINANMKHNRKKSHEKCIRIFPTHIALMASIPSRENQQIVAMNR